MRQVRLIEWQGDCWDAVRLMPRLRLVHSYRTTTHQCGTHGQTIRAYISVFLYDHEGD